MGMRSERHGREKKVEQEWDSSGVTPQQPSNAPKGYAGAPVALRGLVLFSCFFFPFSCICFFCFLISE
jgi:hypothetical protein